MKHHIIKIFFAIAAFIFISCSEKNAVAPEMETLLYENAGLVDSAVVYGCYSYTIRHFVQDTMELDEYSKVRVEFDGNTNSDGTTTFMFLHSENSGSVNIYEVHNNSGINGMHNFEAAKHDNKAWMEVRLYINPPVCGQNEFKFNSARDLRIYGVK